jgi:predicted NUDIX family NTP pyrophosphohydrolase
MTTRSKISAGLLMYRRTQQGELEVLLAHQGGPFFAKRDDGFWTLPKGEIEPGEEPLACAIREFREETGIVPEAARYLELGEVRQRGGKVVHAWAFEGDWQQQALQGNTFELEWPPRSGRVQSYPEIDRAEFFSLASAARKMNAAQVEFLTRLSALLHETG